MLARTLVLTFHGLDDPIGPLAPGEDRYFVPQDTYRQIIGSLDALEAKAHVRPRITFDDGNLSDYTVGMPALLEAGRTGTFFVLAGRIGAAGYLDAAHLREMADAGMEIGSHGWDHVDWRTLDAAGRRREMIDARRKIEDASGHPVRHAAIPFGRFDRSVLGHLKGLDYERVHTSTGGLALEKAWFCPRYSVTDSFDPRHDLAARVGPAEVLRGTLFAGLRRLRYRI